MRYLVVQDMKAETKVGKSIFLFDFFFLLVYGAVSFMFGNLVHSSLQIPYYIFSAVCALFLIFKSSWNKKRRNWESLFLFIRKDREIYQPVVNQSKATKNGVIRRKEADGYEEQ